MNESEEKYDAINKRIELRQDAFDMFRGILERCACQGHKGYYPLQMDEYYEWIEESFPLIRDHHDDIVCIVCENELQKERLIYMEECFTERHLSLEKQKLIEEIANLKVLYKKLESNSHTLKYYIDKDKEADNEWPKDFI